MGTLDRILVSKRAEIMALRGRRLPTPPAVRPFELRRTTDEPLRVIAEIKRRSPSAGELSKGLSVGERALAYERGGARAVSVLTDGPFFDGALEHLLEARAATHLPLLCKDFILDEAQLDAARAYGADAALIIVRCLTPSRVESLIAAAKARELEPLVEVTSEHEADIALDAGAALVGVNARDLDTLAVDPARARRVIAGLPPRVTCVHLSGVGAARDVAELAASRADAALIGELLMRQHDPRPLLAELVAAGRARMP